MEEREKELINTLLHCYVNYHVIYNDINNNCSRNLVRDTIIRLKKILPKEEVKAYDDFMKDNGFDILM